MKTIIRGSLVKRVDDKTARHAVKQLGFSYCPKSYWKEAKVNAGKDWRTLEGIANSVD